MTAYASSSLREAIRAVEAQGLTYPVATAAVRINSDLRKDRNMRIEPPVLSLRMTLAEECLDALDLMLGHVDHQQHAALIDAIGEVLQPGIRDRGAHHARYPHPEHRPDN